MEDLITHANVLFDDRITPVPLHPLPPAPSNEPPANFGYGSSYTQFSSVPPREHRSGSQSSQDFTPQLPPRPSNSIHPSRRANISSRTTSESEDVVNPNSLSQQKKSSEVGSPTSPEYPDYALVEQHIVSAPRKPSWPTNEAQTTSIPVDASQPATSGTPPQGVNANPTE